MTCRFNHLTDDGLKQLKVSLEIERLQLYRTRENPNCSLAKTINLIELVTLEITSVENEIKRRIDGNGIKDLFEGIEVKPNVMDFKEYKSIIEIALALKTDIEIERLFMYHSRELYLSWKIGVTTEEMINILSSY